jgi:pimeloyl-ACP methyl ester carboxylesterase
LRGLTHERVEQALMSGVGGGGVLGMPLRADDPVISATFPSRRPTSCHHPASPPSASTSRSSPARPSRELAAVSSDVVRLRRSFAVALALAISLLGLSAVAPASATADAPASAPSPKLDWKACAQGSECAKLTVPLDYENPNNGKTIKVALLRVRATDPKKRIGSLLLNPGGPGAPGAEFARDFATVLPEELQNRFDVVGFDPRGSGATAPVKCQDNLDGVFAADYSPDTPAERADLAARLQHLARSCEERSGNLLPFVSSESTVRDMDRIRQAVGDKKLTYVGYSYGTYLGTLYAKLFPKKVRALVLDGAIDPNLSAVEIGSEQAGGFERSLDAFLANCSANRRCPFYNAGDSAGAFDRLAAQVDAQPLTAGDGRTLGGGEFDLGVAQALYSGRYGYARLERALAAAARGDGERLLGLSDEYTGRHDDGSYDSSQPAFWAIGCRDGPAVGGPEAYEAAEAQFRAAAPRVGVALLNAGLICAYWPVPPVKSVAPVRIEDTPPIVVIGTTNDPATPLKWSQGLAGEISSGVLLTAEGTQHTSFVTADNTCVDDKVVAYLVDLQPPPNDTKCG